MQDMKKYRIFSFYNTVASYYMPGNNFGSLAAIY